MFAVAIRGMAVSLGMTLCLTAVGSRGETDVVAKLVPNVMVVPSVPPTQSSPVYQLPAPPCPGMLCGLDDLWKRDALKRERPPEINADTVIIDRARFQKEVERFGDPHAPITPELKLSAIGVCFGGYAANGGFGIRTC